MAASPTTSTIVDVSLGSTFLSSSSEHRDSLLAFRYSLKPPSIDPFASGSVGPHPSQRNSLQAAFPTTAAAAEAGGPSELTYSGIPNAGKEGDCVLIWDAATSRFVLERLDMNVRFALDRGTASTAASRGGTPSLPSQPLSAPLAKAQPRSTLNSPRALSPVGRPVSPAPGTGQLGGKSLSSPLIGGPSYSDTYSDAEKRARPTAAAAAAAGGRAPMSENDDVSSSEGSSSEDDAPPVRRGTPVGLGISQPPPLGRPRQGMKQLGMKTLPANVAGRMGADSSGEDDDDDKESLPSESDDDDDGPEGYL